MKQKCEIKMRGGGGEGKGIFPERWHLLAMLIADDGDSDKKWMTTFGKI
jgi:hypothetical protein